MAQKQTIEATREEEFELPPGYEDKSVGFKRAFEHAKRHGNENKAALLYAEAWVHDFEETEDES